MSPDLPDSCPAVFGRDWTGLGRTPQDRKDGVQGVKFSGNRAVSAQHDRGSGPRRGRGQARTMARTGAPHGAPVLRQPGLREAVLAKVIGK